MVYNSIVYMTSKYTTPRGYIETTMNTEVPFHKVLIADEKIVLFKIFG